MTAVLLHIIPHFYTKYSKNCPFMLANRYDKKILSKECCIARHHDKMCFQPNCRYHNIIIGDVEGLLQKLNAFCFNFRHVDCLHTLFKHRFFGKIVVKSGHIFDNVQRTVHLNQQNRGVDRMLSIAKKRFLRKEYKKVFRTPFVKMNRRNLADQSFLREWNKLKKLVSK